MFCILEVSQLFAGDNCHKYLNSESAGTSIEEPAPLLTVSLQHLLEYQQDAKDGYQGRTPHFSGSTSSFHRYPPTYSAYLLDSFASCDRHPNHSSWSPSRTASANRI
jgi:hypothetical protein